ncbi:hypothetical protein [Microtetraspora sp. NBRC 13810]|uniref:hypothetical protein n=1 Tax=Microtetraspora sp. NBRC 13810 TaxID=3030990 RepID=UPI002554723C|nr:hypothetical protein [Microtetraspora sp. NBRC 13810]
MDDETDLVRFDRRQSRIQRHMLVAFALGLAFGVAGAVVQHTGLSQVQAVFDPYAYFLLSAIVGATASGPGWAVLSSLLSTVTPAVFALAGAALLEGYETDVWSRGPSGADLILLAVFCYGVFAYAARRDGYWADLLAGVLGGLLLANLLDKAVLGLLRYVPDFWPGPALAVAVPVIGMVLFLRRGLAARLRGLAVALAMPGALILIAPVV